MVNIYEMITAIADLEKSASKVKMLLEEYEREVCISPTQCGVLKEAISQKVSELMGKDTNNARLKRKLLIDILKEIKDKFQMYNSRGAQFTIKQLQRKDFQDALTIVSEYVPPTHIIDMYGLMMKD